jgi:negative regulator of replication initiation
VKFGGVETLLHLKAKRKICPIVGIFRPVEINIGRRNIVEILLSDSYTHENRQEKKFIAILVTFFFRFVLNSSPGVFKYYCSNRG